MHSSKKSYRRQTEDNAGEGKCPGDTGRKFMNHYFRIQNLELLGVRLFRQVLPSEEHFAVDH